MDLSIFLAQSMGLFFLIMGFALFTNKDRMRLIFTQIVDQSGVMFIVSMYMLILGIILVLSHNIWDSSWRVVITILSWMTLIKATLNLCFPNIASTITEKIAFDSNKALMSSIFYVFLGVFLCYMGF